MWTHKLVGSRSAGRAHNVNLCTRRAGSMAGTGGSLREQPHLLSIHPAPTAHQGTWGECAREWKQESHSLCSHSAENWSSSSHLTVLSRRWVFIACHRWPCSLVQSEVTARRMDLAGASSPCLVWKGWKGWKGKAGGTPGHQPALHAKLTGLSAPPHASTFTSVGGLDMDFRISQDFRLSPLNFLSRMWLTNIHWTSVKCSSINHMWSHKISIPNACHNKFIFYCCNK